MYCYTVSGLRPLLTVLWLCPNSVIYSLASGLECLRDVVLPCQVKQVLLGGRGQWLHEAASLAHVLGRVKLAHRYRAYMSTRLL